VSDQIPGNFLIPAHWSLIFMKKKYQGIRDQGSAFGFILNG